MSRRKRSVRRFLARYGQSTWTAGFAVSPAVADGVVYVAAGRLHALRDWTGAPLWNKGEGSIFIETPAVLNGTVYIAGPGEKLYACDAQTGADRRVSDFRVYGAPVDYVSRSGTLVIPLNTNTLTHPIRVPICGDNVAEPNQTFFVDLPPLPPAAFAGVILANGVGRGTIHDTTLTIGGFQLSPDDTRVQVDEKVTYTVVWTVPEDQVWRDLNTIDLRIRRGEKIALWVSWDEPSNTFSLRQEGDDDDGPGVVCGAAPGAATVLETRFAQLHLAETSVTGSGPTGLSVTLNLTVSFKGKAAGRYQVELAATDDFGNQDDFVPASTVRIKHVHKDD